MRRIALNLGSPPILDCNQNPTSVRAIVRTRSVHHPLRHPAIIDALPKPYPEPEALSYTPSRPASPFAASAVVKLRCSKFDLLLGRLGLRIFTFLQQPGE